MIELVKNLPPTAVRSFKDADDSKIIAYKTPYEIWQVVRIMVNGVIKFGWKGVAMNGSITRLFCSLQELFNESSTSRGKVYQFESSEEYKKWLKENL